MWTLASRSPRAFMVWYLYRRVGMSMTAHRTLRASGSTQCKQMTLVWSIFNSRASLVDHFTWGMCICICVLNAVEVSVTMFNYFVLYVCCMWGDDEGKGKGENLVPARSLLLSISTKQTARLNVTIRRTNRYQQYNMPSQHTVCRLRTAEESGN